MKLMTPTKFFRLPVLFPPFPFPFFPPFFSSPPPGSPAVFLPLYIREISLYVQQRVRVDVGHVFGVKTNPYLKIKYTFEIFHQPAVKL